MGIFNNVVLILHISAGFFGLVVGLIPIFSKKGQRLHTLSGLAFYYAMLVVCITAAWLVFFKPSSLFLLFIAMFSFYMAFVGRRTFIVFKQKKAELQDKLMAAAATISGFSMIFLGLSTMLRTGFDFQSVLYLFFGSIFASTGWQDLQLYWFSSRFLKPGVVQHISKMMGAYIAFVTAFATVNSRYIPHESPWVDMAAWMLPGIIGGFTINRFMRKYIPLKSSPGIKD